MKNNISTLFRKPKLLKISVLLYICSLLIASYDQNFTYRYVTLWVHVVSLLLVLISWIKINFNSIKTTSFWNKNEVIVLFSILIFTISINTFHIFDYPFVSFKDEVRDGGLNAMQIANGDIKNIFGFGSYNGHGLIIPTFASIFYALFENSVMTFRAPSLIISSLSIAFLYFLLRLAFNRLTATVGALTFALLPHNMYFVRTELVLVFDSFWTILALITFYIWLKKQTFPNLALLGITLGKAANFHTPARVIALFIFTLTILVIIKKIAMRNDFKIMKSHFNKIHLLILFCIVGYGPMILFTNTEAFFQSNRFIYSNKVHVINFSYDENKFITLKENYVKSLKVWILEGTTSRYPAHTPLLTKFQFIFFLLGIFYALFRNKNNYYKILILFIFLVPFTNSAITDWLNADHRLAPLFPISAIFIALGFNYISILVKNKKVILVIFLIILGHLAHVTFQFFNQMPAGRDRDIHDYLTMHVLYLLQKDYFNDTSHICISTSKDTVNTMSYAHSKESFEYFANDKTITLNVANLINNGEVIIYKNNCSKDLAGIRNIHFINCSIKKSLYCPPEYSDSIKIYY